MGEIKDRIETLEETSRLHEINDFDLAQKYNKLKQELTLVRFTYYQENEILKAEILLLNKKFNDLLETFDNHQDRIHKLEIKDNLDLVEDHDLKDK